MKQTVRLNVPGLTLASWVMLGLVGCSSTPAANFRDFDGGDTDPDLDASGVDVPLLGPFEASALDEAGKTSTCAALEAYAKCNLSDPCAPLDAKDCYAFDALYNVAGRAAFTLCYGGTAACGADAGASLGQCVFLAASQATPDSAQKKLAKDYCAACPGQGSASACESLFWSAVPNDAGVAGIGAVLEFALVGDATIETIDSSCVANLKSQGEYCGDAFAQCAAALLDPTECNSTTSPVDGGGDSDPGGA